MVQRTNSGRDGPLSDGADAPTMAQSVEQSTVTNPVELFGERYQVLKQVGRGATGVVYKAHDRHLKVDIAIKLLAA